MKTLIKGTPRISVIIPVYNRYASLVRALESVQAQTYPVYEVLIVDDGSDEEIAGQIAALEEGVVRVLRLAQNSGAAAARNVGMAAALGEYIALLDSDDLWRPEKTARQLAFMQQTGSRFSATSYWRHFHYGIKAGWYELYEPAATVAMRHIVSGCAFATTTCLFERSLLAALEPQDEALRRAQDWEWFLRVVALTPVRTLREPLAVIGMHRRPVAEKMFRAATYMRRKHLRALAGKNPLLALRFLSALGVMAGGAAYREGRWLRVLWYTTLAMLCWPGNIPAVAWQRSKNWLFPFRTRLHKNEPPWARGGGGGGGGGK